ncbi:hypothetical protein FOA52_004610 [Chlamydomonas sp. UWO 241]|nr:hypothetical protein FOA52_004610 [Chlamydomonas sp. UWO 241]
MRAAGGAAAGRHLRMRGCGPSALSRGAVSRTSPCAAARPLLIPRPGGAHHHRHAAPLPLPATPLWAARRSGGSSSTQRGPAIPGAGAGASAAPPPLEDADAVAARLAADARAGGGLPPADNSGADRGLGPRALGPRMLGPRLWGVIDGLVQRAVQTLSSIASIGSVDLSSGDDAPSRRRAALARLVPGIGCLLLVGTIVALLLSQPVDMLQYKLLQVIMLPTWGKVLVLIAFAVPFMLIGMTWLHYSTDVSLGLSLRRAYFVLNDVPDHIINETDDRALPPLIVLHIISMVTFAVLLGVFIDDISNGVSAFKSGNFPIPERNHTVIVASDKRQLVHVLREVFANQTERALQTNSMVAVLHTGSKEDLDNDLMDLLGPEAMAHVVTRSGSPLKTADFALVSGGTARTVVMLQAPAALEDDGDDDDGDTSAGSALAMSHKAQQAVALANLQSLRADALTVHSAAAMKEPLLDQHVLLQQDPANDEDSADGEWDAVTALLRGHGSQVVTKMSSSSNLARIMCQTSVTPGLSEVLAMMAQHSKGGPEIYLREVTCQGATFRESRRHYDKAVACGIYVASTGTMTLCPRDDVVLQTGDRLLLMAEDAKQAAPRSSLSPAVAAAAAEADAKEAVAPKPKAVRQSPSGCSGTGRYVMLCFEPGEVDAFASAMHEFCPPGSEIVLVCRDAVKLRKKDFPGVSMQVIQGDPGRTSTLRAARVQDATTVMVAGLGGLKAAEGDAQTLSTLLQIKSLLREGGGNASERLHVVACVNEQDTRAAMAHVAGLDAGAGRGMSLDLVAAEEILSGILAQVACEPMMLPVWADLMDADGCEIYVKSVRALDLPTDVALTWAAVQESLAPHQTIALGYVGGDGQPVLMPEPAALVVLREGDKLVVICEN